VLGVGAQFRYATVEGRERSVHQVGTACVYVYARCEVFSEAFFRALARLHSRPARKLVASRTLPLRDRNAFKSGHELYQLACLALLGYSITIPGQAVEKSLGQLALCTRACGGL